MRKDVKIGLAVAGVLFAVLIVYLLVPGRTDDGVATNDENAQQTDGTGGNDAAPADGTGDPVVPQIPSAVAQGTPSDDAFAPGGAAAPADAGGTQVADGNAAGGTDWLKSFETGQVVGVESHPPLAAITRTPQPGDRAAAVTDADHGPGTAIADAGGATGAPSIPAVGESTGGPVTPSDAAGPVTPSDPGSAGGTAVSESPGTASGSRGVGTSAGNSANGGARTHVIRQGETFSSIAKAVYGKSSYYLQIQKANPDVNPNAIRPGTTIKLPEVTTGGSSDSTQAATTNGGSRGGAREQAPVNSATEYRIQPGDSLYKISVKLYGNGGHVDELYETNAATIGSDPARLKVGTVLKLHDAPRVAGAR